ncbi:MAG: VCBS repeat-containing protein, partial [Rhizomicrobium sp.]
MVPALSLDYSSQNASDGLEGWGFTLSGLPSVTRCAMTYAQDGIHGGVNFNVNDRFCLEGQRLIAVNGTYGANGTEYRTEIDGFSKIVSYGASGSGPLYFLIWTKSGQIMEFGNTADSRGPLVSPTCTYPSTCQTGPAGTVRVWAVDKISDTRGNYIQVTYDNGTPDTTYGQVYPTKIAYTGNTVTGLMPYNSVQFAYTTRIDDPPTYQAGALLQTTKLLSNIETYAGTTLVHNYYLQYWGPLDASYPAILYQVTLCGYNAQQVRSCLAPTTFGWQGSNVMSPPSAVTNPLSGELHTPDDNNLSAVFNSHGLTDVVELAAAGTACPNTTQSVYFGSGNGYTFTPSNINVIYNPTTNYDCNSTTNFFQNGTYLLDIDGDGLTDVLNRQYSTQDGNLGFTGYWYVLHNNGAGSLNTVSYLNIGDYPPSIGDFNGDGRSDIYFYNQVDFLLSNGDGTFNEVPTNFPNFGASDGDTIYAYDFDGDGCTDILSFGNVNNVYYSCQPAIANLGNPANFGNMYHDGWTPHFGDFNGDGKMDILWTNSTTMQLWLSTGTGFVVSTPSFPGGDLGALQIQTGDFNGDGKTDLVIATEKTSGVLDVWRSTGTGFVDSGTGVNLTNPNGRDISVYVSDWNGDGGPDIWTQFTDADTSDTEYLYTYVPLAVAAVVNGLGVTTAVTYDRL